jgi:hypothetical protein
MVFRAEPVIELWLRSQAIGKEYPNHFVDFFAVKWNKIRVFAASRSICIRTEISCRRCPINKPRSYLCIEEIFRSCL